MVEEARLEQLDGGVTPVTDGWFVVGVPEAAWVTNEVLGDCCIFEGDDVSFPQLGFTIAVLQPGQAGGRYHREANQEDFLVLAGECLLLILVILLLLLFVGGFFIVKTLLWILAVVVLVVLLFRLLGNVRRGPA